MQHGYQNLTVRSIAIDDRFVEHGDVADLRALLGLDAKSVAEVIEKLMKEH